MSDLWLNIPFSELPVSTGRGINPFEFPDEEFELYSVPAHETGAPEIVLGKTIGSNKQIVSEGMVLLCKINPRINRTWVVSPSDGHRQIASTEWIAFENCSALKPKFLMYFMQQTDFHDFLASNASGVGGSLMRIKPATLAAYPFKLPGQRTQQAIVEKLEELFSDLDAGVSELKAAQKKLAQYRQSLLKAAVEGALTAEWRKKQSPLSPTPLPQRGEGLPSPLDTPLSPRGRGAGGEGETGPQLLERILKERRARWEEKQLAKFKEQGKTPPKGWQDKYPQPVQPDTTNLSELPEGWVWASVEQISNCVADGVHKKPNYVSQGIPFVTVRNLTAGPGICFENIKYITLNDHLEFIKRTHPERGDILISKDGTLGVTRVINTDVDFSIFVSVALVKPVLKSMSQFLGIAFTSPVVQRQMTPKGSGLVHIHLEDLRKDCIPLPPSLEQQEICEIVETRLNEVESQELAIQHSLTQATAQRKNILKSAFSGQLVAQDPNDEPASVLLERIRAERQKQPNNHKPGRGRKKKEAK